MYRHLKKLDAHPGFWIERGILFFFFPQNYFSEESCSNTRTAGEGWQKRPIQQKILKPCNTNPLHYRQTSLANHWVLPCNTDDCAVWLSQGVCVCVASSDLSNGCQEKTNMNEYKDAELLHQSGEGCPGPGRKHSIKQLTKLINSFVLLFIWAIDFSSVSWIMFRLAIGSSGPPSIFLVFTMQIFLFWLIWSDCVKLQYTVRFYCTACLLEYSAFHSSGKRNLMWYKKAATQSDNFCLFACHFLKCFKKHNILWGNVSSSDWYLKYCFYLVMCNRHLQFFNYIKTNHNHEISVLLTFKECSVWSKHNSLS